MVKIIMNGYLGKMGQVICNLVKDNDDCEIVAGIDTRLSQSSEIFPVFNDIESCDMPADVIVDFSNDLAVPKLLKYAKNKKIAIVLCTTGLSKQLIDEVIETSLFIPIFRSANMSLGVNLLSNVLKKIAPILYDENFDIEIIEKHHNQKIDAPSGTAILMADKINESLNNILEYNYDRHLTRDKRNKNEIGLLSMRGGNIVGEHEVIFAGKDEVIEFKHSAYSKDIFAIGALKAAKYIIDKKPGMYNMDDLMSEFIKN